MKTSHTHAALLALTLTVAGAGASAQPQPAADAGARPTAAAQAPVTLRFRYVAGQRVRYTTRTVQMLPGTAGQATTTGAVSIETVRVNADGSAEQRLRVESLDMTGRAIPPEVRERFTRAMRGVTMEYTQNPRGQITARRPATGITPEIRPIVDAVMESLDQMSAQLPESPVSVGQSWNESRTLHLAPGAGANLDMNVNVTYTLREVRGTGTNQTAVIGLAMTTRTAQGAQIATIPVTGAGSATGELVAETGRGAINRSQSNGSMTLELTVRGRSTRVETRFENEMRRAPTG